MKKNSGILAAGIALALMAGSSQAQSIGAGAQAMDGGITPDAAGCTFNFGSGAFIWCLSSTGNLQRLTSPSGAEFINAGTVLEGYGVCAAGGGPYNDLGGGGIPAGFGPPSVLAGPTSTGVTISRTTLDGRFRLEQKWSADKTERDLTVQMTLINLTGGTIGSVQLLRIVDVDANSNAGGNNFDKTRLGTWIRQIDALSVMPITQTSGPSTAIIPFATASGAFPCAPASLPVPGGPSDVASVVRYDIGSLGSLKKAIVKIGYQVQ